MNVLSQVIGGQVSTDDDVRWRERFSPNESERYG